MQRPSRNLSTDEFVVAVNECLGRYIESTLEGRPAPFDAACLLRDKVRALADVRNCWEVKGCGRDDCGAFQSDDYRCWLLAGTLCGGTVQGTFAQKYDSCVHCDVYQQVFDLPERTLVEHIGALVYHLEERAAQLHARAVTDPLTGLGNRRLLEEWTADACAIADRVGRRFGLIVADMDGLKRINDTAGHEAGDRAIAAFAGILAENVRSADRAFRLGGDEFVVAGLCHGGDCLASLVDRIRHRIQEWNEANAASVGFSLGASFGWELCASADAIEGALRVADARMYAEKTARRAARPNAA